MSYLLDMREQRDIARVYQLGHHTQQDLADDYKVSVGTIRVVLRKFGLSGNRPQISTEQAKVLDTVEKHHLNDAKLVQLIHAPALNLHNVIAFLKEQDTERLVSIFSHTRLANLVDSRFNKEPG